MDARAGKCNSRRWPFRMQLVNLLAREAEWNSNKDSSSKCAADRGWSRRSTTASRISPRCGSPASPMMPRASRSRSSGMPRSAPASSQEDTWSRDRTRRTGQPEVLAAHLRAIRWRSCDGGRPRSAAGAIPRRHPARRLSAAPAAQGAAAAARQSADRRRRRPRQDGRGRARRARAAAAAAHRFHRDLGARPP